MTRIGVLGGTFNPIHLGHLRATEEVAELLSLERVLLVPSAQPPHKVSAAPLAPGALRLAWVEAACAGNPRLCVCDIEVARGGPSYTVDTLRALAERNAPARPVFIIGSDAFAELDMLGVALRVGRLLVEDEDADHGAERIASPNRQRKGRRPMASPARFNIKDSS